MNKEYTYIDGKVIIKDENNRQKPDEYYDNIDEVLIQENVIETMEDKIKYLEKESKKYQEWNSKPFIPFILPMCSIITIFGSPIFSYLLGNTDVFVSNINTIFGVMNEALSYSFIFSIVLLPLAAIGQLAEYSTYKNRIKNEKGFNSQLEYLKKQIIEEKELLEKLKQDKTRENENKEFRVVKVDDLEQLKILKSYLNFYFTLGYAGENYYKHYQNGTLEEKLKKEGYTDTGIELAKIYLEEKGPILVKRKNNKNR